MKIEQTQEFKRLKEGNDKIVHPWRKWGAYVSDRAWGTVREDYSKDGDAWEYFPFKDAKSRTYRWGEDAIAGFCDRYQTLVLGWAFWNGQDPFLKERLFGLTTWEGNHGEDVKEYYYHIDALPTFSYAKFLYKYPINLFPYEKLYEENKKRGPQDREFELTDTGIFNQNAYFDLYIEYAKADPEDIFIKLEVCNRSNRKASLHVLPQLTFRNQWSWEDEKKNEPVISLENQALKIDDTSMESPSNLAFDYHLNQRYFYASLDGDALFTNNETNKKSLWNEENNSPYVKDAFHRKIVESALDCVNEQKKGTKAAIHQQIEVDPESVVTLFYRLTDKKVDQPFEFAEKIFSERKKDADEYYAAIQPEKATQEEKEVQRRAFAGMLWSEQIYLYDVSKWLVGDSKKSPPPTERVDIRNNHWRHLNSMRILSMPDKWEYPWFAAWDLAFHTITLAPIDLNFAKNQLWLLLFDQFLHPNGQIPAYEWEFSDVNPPVQAFAALKIYEIEKKRFGTEDKDFLEKCFHKLLLNFSWWVNKIDATGKNVFEGGFLGLDNITIIDRSDKSMDGHLDEADGSGWMAMFCFNLMHMALILSERNRNYESLATKFFEHYVYIAAALRKGYWRDYDMLDEKDYFFYSVMKHKNGEKDQFRIRSLVGVIPLFASGVLNEEYIQKFEEFYANFTWFCKNRAHLTEKCIQKVNDNQYLFSLMGVHELEKFLKYFSDSNEFKSDFGLRSLSKYHEKHPFTFKDKSISYEPGESVARIKGGNSNWRGPVWFPTSYLFIESLKSLTNALGDEILIGDDQLTIRDLSEGYKKRLISIFTKDSQGKRPVFGDDQKMQDDPLFNEQVLFFEHYHGDTGRGLGASHQTGWSGLVANLIQNLYS